MEACCSFKSIVGSPRGYDAKDRKRQTKIIPLLSCSKDITGHLSSHRFSGVKDEIDFILSRVAWPKESIESMTICPQHHAVLGITWTRGGSTSASSDFRTWQIQRHMAKRRPRYMEGGFENTISKYRSVCRPWLMQVIVFMFFGQFHSKAEEHA